MGWTDERIETLKKLWLDGLSASQIAKQLGGVTRNAVIGKVHRLGLSGRAAPSQPARPAYKPPRPVSDNVRTAVTNHQTRSRASQSNVSAQAETVDAITGAASRPLPVRDEAPGSATVLTLGAHMCKWPIGDPSSEGFTFCGKSNGGEGPYCVEHARIAYQPATGGKKKSTVNELTRSLRRYI
jgi:GcrA cell cycle regulator